MILDTELMQKLKLKTLLLDTCVLGKIRHNVKHPKIQDLLQDFDTTNCPLYLSDFIRIEFLRDSNSYKEAYSRKQVLEELCEDLSFPIKDSVFKEAVTLSCIYARKKIERIDFVDLITSALLKNFTSETNGLVLVTTNHKDFPLAVHDRIGVVALDVEKEVISLGFYRVNPAKWSSEESMLKESPEWKVG